MSHWLLRLSIVLTACISMAPTCRRGFEPPSVPAIESFDWAPESGGYGIQWREGAANSLTNSDLKRYVLTAKLASPVTEQLEVNLQVMAGSTQVGTMQATFAKGATTPTTVYPKNAGADHTPSGTSALTGGKFWLACTTVKGNIRGNAEKSETKSADVYLRVGADQSKKTPKHRVTCAK